MERHILRVVKCRQQRETLQADAGLNERVSSRDRGKSVDDNGDSEFDFVLVS